MNIKEKVKELLKYCSSYHGHVNMMDERRTSYDFKVIMPEETEILSNLDTLQFILLTGEAGDGKSHLIHAIEKELKKKKFQIVSDFSAETEESKKEIIQKVKDIAEGNSRQRMIVAANVGVFTKTVLMQPGALMEKLNKKSSHIQIINFEKRNLAKDKNLFARIVKAFLEYDRGTCPDEKCCQKNSCTYKKNLDFLLSDQGIESVRVLCDTISLMGEHVTFRELLSMLSYLVTFSETCEQRWFRKDSSECSYENIFEKKAEGKLFSSIRQMDPAFKDNISDNRNYPSVEECRVMKRQKFFHSSRNRYELLAVDYLTPFKNVISLFQKELYIDSGTLQEGELYRLKRGLGRLTRRGQSDLAMKVVDTPAMLGDDIQTEFELGNIDIVWHRYGLDFNILDKDSHMAEEENRFCMSYIYQGEEKQIEAITMVVDYRLFRYLMMADEYYYLSHNSKSIEEYTINTFFRKILKTKKGAYEKMTVRFADQKQKNLCDFSLAVQEKSLLLHKGEKIVNIRREG